MLIAQISDSHLAGKGKETYGIAPMAENLQRCIDHINACVPAVDVVLMTGDLGDSGSAAEMRQAGELLARLKCPVYMVPGNHDTRGTMLAAFGNTACPSASDAFINYVIDGFDLRLIAFDSTIPGKSGGEICEARAAWLEEQLSAGGNRPTIIFMHHPPVKCSVRESDEDGFIGAAKLAAMIEKHTNIECILCGHIHLVTHTRWHGTIVSTAPSMGMQLDFDLTMTRPSMFYLSPPAYLLHHWTPQKNLITHTITLQDNTGPFLFEQQ